MWKELPKDQIEFYKRMILAFSSLSEMFAQKAESDSEQDDESDVKLLVSPIINSKYQETVFQKSFHAKAEDIGNTSYDASIFLNSSTQNKKIYVGGAPAVYFEYKVVGKATKDKPYPIYISLHGGGRTTKEVNDQQWKNQINLYDIQFGIYIAPRAPWDDWNMWFQEPIDRVIEEFIKIFYYF